MGITPNGTDTMRNRLSSKAIYFSVFLIVSLLLSGQALACLSPSMLEMREDRSMACCAEHCRFETSDQAAQKACEQSRQAGSQDEPLLNQPNPYVSTMGKSLLDSGPLLPMDLATRNQIHSTLQIKEHDLSKRFISVEIYTLNRSFLI